MKKIISLFLALSFFSCNDGDFDIPEFEFDHTVYSCFEYVLYITSNNRKEAMAMTLIDSQLDTTVGEKSFPISSSTRVALIPAKDMCTGSSFIIEKK